MTAEIIAQRLKTLRKSLTEQKLDAFLVPMADEYQSEYVPPSARRIEYLTGFTGSAAFVVVMQDTAAFFTDSRYTLQAGQQVPLTLYTPYDTAQKLPTAWVLENARADMRIGFDPLLHTARGIANWRAMTEGQRITLVPVSQNPIDQQWAERPPIPNAPIIIQELKYAGKPGAEKRQALAADLQKKTVDAAILTDPASIAWLLNVRGGDVPHTPLPLSYAIAHKDGSVDWFVPQSKAPNALVAGLGPDVRRREVESFASALSGLGLKKAVVRIDPSSTSFAYADILEKAGAELQPGEDPCLLPKACKNPVELDGMRACHRRDGTAMSSLLAWLDATESTTELAVEAELEQRRRALSLYQGPSFDTIAGSGPNGAIVHYRATDKSNRQLQKGEFLLLDTGGQYLDGTTDITRTIPLGDISSEMKDRFTRVLKGHIALASARFPSGATGADLDILARQYLWDAGLDYGHGTGHGVGSYLGVHEGPQSISHRSDTPLCPGMVLSNEPGYYETNRYGIRIESLLAVVPAPEISTATRSYLKFETITLVPIDTRAIAKELLTLSERDWLNDYHARVHAALRPMISDPCVLLWLEQRTAPL